jgi:hypothetical protein
VYTNIP